MKEGMRDAIRNELKEEMKDEVKISLETELRTKYEPIIRSASEQELEEKRKTINEEMEQKRRTMDEEMEQKRKAIEQEMEQKRQQMEKKLEEERQQMGKNLDVERQQMEQNIQHQITNEYRTILEREVNDDIKEMRNTLETDLQREIESKRNELEARLRDELTAQLLNELRPKVEQQLRSEIGVDRSSSPMMISVDERENYEEKIKELKSENETIEKEHEDLLMCLYDMEEKVNKYRDKLKSLDALSDEESEGEEEEEEFIENEEEVEVEEKEEEEISSSPTRSRSSSKSPVRSPAKSPIRSPLRSQSPEKSPVKSPVKSPEKSPVKSPMKLPLEMSQNQSYLPFMTTPTPESKEDSFINAAPSPLPSMIPHHQISFNLPSNLSSPNPLQFMNDVAKPEEKINEISPTQTQNFNAPVSEISKETQIPGIDTSSQNDDGWGFTDDWDIPEAKAKSPSVTETKSPTFKEISQTTSLNVPTMPNLLFTPPSNNNNNNNNNGNGWNTDLVIDKSNPLEKEKPEIIPPSQPEPTINAINNANKTSPNQENIPFDMNMANDTNDGWNVDGWDTGNDFMSFGEKSKENASPLPSQPTASSMFSPKNSENLKSPLNSATKPTSSTSNNNFSFNTWNTNSAKSPQPASQPTTSLFSPKMNESSKSPLDSFINAATKTTSTTSNSGFSFDSWNNNAKSPQPAAQPTTSLFSPKMNESQKSPFDSFINAATKNTSFPSNTGFSSFDPKNNNIKSPQPTAQSTQSTASLFSPKMNEGQKSPFDSFINSATKPTSASSNNGFSFDSWNNSVKSPPSTTRTEKKSDNEWGFTNSWNNTTTSTSSNNGNGWGFDTTTSDKKSNAGSHHNYSGNSSFADSLFKGDNTNNSFGNQWLSPTRKDSDPNKKSIAPLALGGSKFGGIKSSSNIGFGQRTPPSGSSGFMHRSPSQQTNDHLFSGGQNQNDSHHRPGSTTGSNSNLFGNIGSNNNSFFSNQPSNTSNFSFSRYRG